VSGISAQVGFGGAANPLWASLPDRVEVVLKEEPEVGHLVALMQSESAAERCGAASVLNRLGEVLFVRLLRHLIETGQTRPGVLGGLSDPRISRALVAMHDRPEQSWSPADLAEVAGLSRSRFSEVFQQVVGETPAAYLRRWRLVLARQDLEKGARVEGIAHRYGFASSDSFARAFRRWFGETPLAVRQAATREV
jgi:AraC-like DNA-binding protein